MRKPSACCLNQTPDKNGDGFISPSELAQTLSALGETLTEADVAQMISKVDADGNGSLDYREFVTMMTEQKVAKPGQAVSMSRRDA